MNSNQPTALPPIIAPERFTRVFFFCFYYLSPAIVSLPWQEGDEAGEDANDEDEDSPATAGKDAADLTPPPPPPAPPAPDTQLSLEWVYGYSAASSRASVCYTASGATPDGVGVVYPAGKVAVVLAQPVDEEGAETEGGRTLRHCFLYSCTVSHR